MACASASSPCACCAGRVEQPQALLRGSVCAEKHDPSLAGLPGVERLHHRRKLRLAVAVLVRLGLREAGVASLQRWHSRQIVKHRSCAAPRERWAGVLRLELRGFAERGQQRDCCWLPGRRQQGESLAHVGAQSRARQGAAEKVGFHAKESSQHRVSSLSSIAPHHAAPVAAKQQQRRG